MNIKKNNALVLSIVHTLAFACVLSVFSCKTVPTEIPAKASEAELLQLGQTAIDEGNYKAAEFYYKAVIAVYGENKASSVIAEYEIAHMKIKRKNYKEAKPALEKILLYYDDPQLQDTLSPEYKKLAQIDLEKCEPKSKNAQK